MDLTLSWKPIPESGFQKTKPGDYRNGSKDLLQELAYNSSAPPIVLTFPKTHKLLVLN